VRQVIDQIVKLLHQGITAIFRFVELVWQWSFGQMFAIFQSNWQAGVEDRGSRDRRHRDCLRAVPRLLSALARRRANLQGFVELLMVFVAMMPYMLVAGIIAAAGSYVLQNVNL
jgi:hypothetical protein